MSRNGAGVYTLPASYLAEAGDTILADQHNSPLEDLQTDANTPRPIVAGGTGASSAVSARTNLSVMSVADIQSGYVPKVATKAALSALDTASFKAAVLTETTREKLWMWKSGDFSAEEAADTDNVNYIPSDGVSTALGCWVAATGDGVTVRTIAAGGTGADNAADARTNLGLAIGADVQAHSAILDATTASFTTAQETKLSGIETGADVTDATNVNAAGAVMNTDTATTDMQFVGSGSDLSIDPAKLLKRGDAEDAIDAAVTPVVATRTALAAVATATHTVAYLTEAGREGTFLWDASDLSTYVTADTQQGIYVAPSSDTTGASGAWVRVHNTGEFLIEWFGGKRNDTTFDNKAAHDAAVAVLLATGFNVLLFATGVYTYLSAPAPHTFGVQLKGAGHGSALDNGATNLERRFNQTNTAAFLKWDGTGPEFNSTGGGIQRLNVVAASGTSGGVAVHLYATSDSQRPGYFEISHVLVWGTSGGTWAYALIQDGSNCTTASGQGLRDVAFTNVYLSGATVETCQIINGTNNQYMGLYVYQAGGSSAVMRITGTSSASTSKSTNGFGSIYVSGDLILQNCDHQILFGYATTLTVTGDTTNSKFYGDYSSVVFSGITRYAAANSNNTQVFDKTTLQGIAGSTSGSRLAPDGIMEAWGQASIATTATTVTMGVTFGAAPNVQLTPINATACYANLTAQPTTTTFAAIANVGPINVGWRAVGRAA